MQKIHEVQVELVDSKKLKTLERIESLRGLMCEYGIDASLFLTSDPHLNEYIAPRYKSIEFLLGFVSSAGSLLVTHNACILLLDGRYILQAKRQFSDYDIEIVEINANYSLVSLLTERINIGANLSLDFEVIPHTLFIEIQEALSKKNVVYNNDLLSFLWNDRVELFHSRVFIHDIKYASKSTLNKISHIKELLLQNNASYALFCTLDDIAWISNLRGSDICYNPLFTAYLVIGENNILFCDNDISDEIISYLKSYNIILRPYGDIFEFLEGLNGVVIMLDNSKITHKIYLSVCNNEIIHMPTHILAPKEIKDSTQIMHIKDAMVADGVALCRFMIWFESALSYKECLSEVDIDAKIAEFRAQSSLYISDSFATIAGFNANGALPHYRATYDNFAYISGNGLLLFDSGAHYINGTTDITRVLPVGYINDMQRRDFTLVLKALIALSSTKFPQNTKMAFLDSIPRRELWNHGLDYAHGTGHGVGYFLNVHEGVHSISQNVKNLSYTDAKEGMISSIEPGIYRENLWGVRLENLVCNIKSNIEGFLEFETLTLCPFARECIDISLLEQKEKDWLNTYHHFVFMQLRDKLEASEIAWLADKTRAI